MPFCIRCQPANCGSFENIISINLSISSNFKELSTEGCNSNFGSPAVINPPLSIDPTTPASTIISPGVTRGRGTSRKVINGPLVGNISVTAYAFGAGQDPWNGSRCEGTASANQGITQKQDFFSNSTYIIPSKNANSSIKGDVGSIASISEVYVSTEERRLQNINGISIGTRLGIDLGSSFSYTGLPIAVDMPNNSNFFNVLEFNCCFLTSFSYSVNFPTQPAQATYTFQFIKNGASNNGGRGTGNKAGGLSLDIDTLSPADIFAPVPNIGF